LSNDLEPKVADFGLSKIQATDDVLLSEGIVGPLKWMAPESIRDGHYSTKTDAYSFGIVSVYKHYLISDELIGLLGSINWRHSL
jgi:Janus kinase 2